MRFELVDLGKSLVKIDSKIKEADTANFEVYRMI
jgi:hypothetical protein